MWLEQSVFWAAALMLGYTYAGYPLVVWMWARLRGQDVVTGHVGDELPFVTILVVAHNEESRIAARVENLLGLDYPADRLDIVIASDASTDQTVARACDYIDRGVRVVEFRAHQGKPAVLNELIPRLEGEIVALMDVRQRIEKGALRALVENFHDPRTGVVSGELLLDELPQGSEVGGVGFYWRYEKFIRQREALIDSSVGATGAIYAIRRRLFRCIPADTLLDDVMIPMQIARQGYRIVFEPRARAHDHVAATASAEFTRKVRTIAGNYQLLFRHPWLLHPFRNRLWFQTLSHKFCRLLCPLCLVLVLMANLMLVSLPFYQMMLVVQILFYAAALLVGYSKKFSRSRAFGVPYAFCLLNWATVMGLVRYARGQQKVTWQKAQG